MVADPGPTATSPQGAVRLLEWAIGQRDLEAIEGLLTEDFEYRCVAVDSAGNVYRAVRNRGEVLAALRRVFLGAPGQPPATSVTVRFARNLVPFPDPRMGYVDSLFKSIRTSVDVRVGVGPDSVLETTGSAVIYTTRGDTAAIPHELRARGFPPNKWWISHIEDETFVGHQSRWSASAVRILNPTDVRRLRRPSYWVCALR